jgi:glucose 1-dehydrogenase
MSRRLDGMFALITGASRGIGRAVALQFARDGATVAINHFTDAVAAADTLAALNAISARPHRVEACDVADPTAGAGMIAECIAAWGRLDCLINNAGIQAETPGDGFDPATLKRILEVNLVGAATLSAAAIAHFKSRPGGGVIINTSSVHEAIPKPGYLAYALSKGAMGNMTRTLALEFARDGIRVNAVAPGAVTTDLNASWINDPVRRADVERHIPMGRAAEADEIAPVFAFLASAEARYITGQTIYACGGLTLYPEFAEKWSS